MAKVPRDKHNNSRFWNEITPESVELSLPSTAWRHEAKVNKQIQVYAQLHLLQQLIDSLPVCVSYVDKNRCYQYANVTYQAWFGVKPEDIYGQPLESVIGTTAYQWAKVNVDRALAGETVVFEAVMPYKAGGNRYVQGTLVPDYSVEGTVQGYFALIQDLSDRKAAELALQRKVAREHTLWQITQRIRQTLDLQSILGTATEEVQRHLQVDRTLLIQFTSDHSGAIIRATAQPTCSIDLASRQWQAEGLRQRCHQHYGQGTVRAIVDLDAEIDNLCLSPWIKSMAAKSAIVAPILHPQLDELDNLWGFLIVQTCTDYRRWESGEADLLAQVADQLAIAVQQANLLSQVQCQAKCLAETNQALERANQRLNDLSHRDELTQIANRRYFDTVLQREWKRLSRSQSPLSLIIFDVDHFKQFNDYHGHPTGDDCLTTVAQTSQQMVNRLPDIVARYGGEEFAVVLPHTDLAGAATLAETIRARIRDLNIVNFKTATETVYITISSGVACQVPSRNTSLQTLISEADQALYRAKQEGRNRVVCWGE
ncbi:diguanylate cyclase [Nodosilinea sp. LEGE 07298]|uniref:diguanylate cyclase domain-containing protein n=1 Tax=Nodosilinea sp. LEGE 07298 TaxID=2777970 RepID=UPI0018801F03|nr:diguanylate cyclase [Nodosilinea sp. LEGE 07298]MBE9109712.1 diguanylate cyclase [Nodosilinea sp. LEGE 07298]